MVMRAILFLIKLGILGAIVAFFVANPGAATVEFQGWRLDMPVGVLALAVVVLAGLLAFGDRIRRGLVRLPTTYRSYRSRSRRAKGYQAVTQGLTAAAAGDANEAARQARRANALLDDPALTRLLSAQAAQLNGEDDAARRYFEGMLEDPNTAFMGVRGLMMQAVKSGDKARALELAERAYRLRPDTPWVVRELLDLQEEHGRRESALETLSRAEKIKALPAADIARRRAALLLAQARQARREGLTRKALKLARQAIKADPAAVEAVRLAAALLREEGKPRKAARLVEEAWRAEPDPSLVEVYRDLAPTGTTALGQVKRFEQLLALQPDHPESHLALAVAALDAQLWGAARHHLETLAAGDPSPRVCRLMARLEEDENGDLEAAHRWLARAMGDDAGLAPEDEEPDEPETTETGAGTAPVTVEAEPVDASETKPERAA